jgi:hypothetical protein
MIWWILKSQPDSRTLQPNRLLMRVVNEGSVNISGRATVSSRSDVQAETFDAFFREAKKPLVAMAYLLTGDLAAAQDLTQEALLRTWAPGHE